MLLAVGARAVESCCLRRSPSKRDCRKTFSSINILGLRDFCVKVVYRGSGAEVNRKLVIVPDSPKIVHLCSTAFNYLGLKALLSCRMRV
jgi:hypothetical protein